jgi:hypothetical protein
MTRAFSAGKELLQILHDYTPFSASIIPFTGIDFAFFEITGQPALKSVCSAG